MLILLLLPILSFSQEIGTIAFFETDCPKGWKTYVPAFDKTLISAGGQYTVGQTGGEKQHKMTVEELASHSHKNKVYSSYPSTYKQKYDSRNTYPIGKQYSPYDNTPLRSSDYDFENSNEISPTGEGKPFNIMQPYLALNCCKKIQDSLSQELQKLKETNQSQYKTLYIYLIVVIACAILAICCSLTACYFGRFRSTRVIRLAKGNKLVSEKSSSHQLQMSSEQTA